MSGSDPLLAEPNLADCDGHPHDHDGQTGHGHQYQINRGSGHDAGQQCQQTADHAQAKRGHRHSPAIGFGDVVWDHVFVRQGPQHACGGVQPGVRSRKNRGEHNEVHHVAGERQTNGVEHQHEGAFVHTGVLPRNQRSHDHDGTDEEDDETEQGGVARLRDGFVRIFGLAGRYADQLGAGEGEVHRQHGGEHRHPPVGEQSVLHEVLE